MEDTGPGIDPDKADKLFAAYEQMDDSTTRCYGGTGLGLTICKRLSEAMGGGMGVQSEIGKGALFWVELPLEGREQKAKESQAMEVPDATVNASESQTTADDETQLSILVVEDNEVNRLVICGLLCKLGFEAEVLVNGEQGVNAQRCAAGIL